MRGIPDRPTIIGGEALVADLHRVLTWQPGAIDRVCIELGGLNYQTVYSQVAGQTKGLPLDTLRAAHFVTGSRVLERHLLWPGRRSIPDTPNQLAALDPERECGDVDIAAAKLHQLVRDAVGNGHISAEEDRAIRAQADQAIRELTDVLALLDQAREHGGRLD